MLVIYRAKQAELISCPQDVARAWELAELMQRQTGVAHFVGRI